MRTATRIVIGAVVALLGVGAAGVTYVVRTGLSARKTPGALETRLARAARRLAVPATVRHVPSPVSASAGVVAEGLEHFADHCAVCHGNDGSGDTEMNRGLYPRAPDMRTAVTQQLTDGELFYIIENGVRFTGMPGWSTGTADGEASTWHLVQFVRHLPHITPDELDRMQGLNPRSPDAIRQDIEQEQFLSGAGQ